jgi:hypothetical protein
MTTKAIPHSTSCPEYYKIGAGCRCDNLCPLPEEDSDGEHVWKFYELGADLAVEQDARFVSVCDQCAEIQYLKELPEGADTIGPTRGNA